jgi:hypothetical protein
MAATTVARKRRRGGGTAARLAVTGLAATTAAALAIGSAPLAGAATLDVDQQVLTAGPLVNLLPALGITSIGPLALGSIPIIAPDGAFLTLDLVPIDFASQSIYNIVNAYPFKRRTGALGIQYNTNDRVYSLNGADAGQFPAVLSSGIGTRNSIEAYRAQISAVESGIPPNGYTPYQPGVGRPNQTNQELLWLRNPLRPNGGVQARFAPLLNIFGVDTSVPGPGIRQGAGGLTKLNTGTVDLTWAYDPMSDLPVTLNPFSILNTLFAALPTNLLGGINSNLHLLDATDPNNPVPATTTTLGISVASTLGLINRIAGLDSVDPGKAFYGTLLPNDLPILEPLRLPSRILNALFGWDLGTPFADALQPALEILVNTGYSDVIAPDELDACAVKCNTVDAQTYAQLGYSAYDRSFLTPSISETFLSVAPLTPAQWLQVPGDVFQALITGFRDVFVPSAPQSPPASVVAPTAATVLSVTPAPAHVAQSVAEVADEAAAEVAVQADATPEPAPESDFAVAVDPAVDPVEVESTEPAASPRKARGSTALSAPAAESSEAAAPRAGAMHRSARQDAGSSATRRSAVRSAAN